MQVSVLQNSEVIMQYLNIMQLCKLSYCYFTKGYRIIMANWNWKIDSIMKMPHYKKPQSDMSCNIWIKYIAPQYQLIASWNRCHFDGLLSGT